MRSRLLPCLAIGGALAAVFVSLFGLWANARAEESLRVEAVVTHALRAPVVRVRRFARKNAGPEQVVIQVRERELDLSPADVHNFHLLSRNTVVGLDYVTVRCANDVDIVNETVDRQRLAALVRFRSSLFEGEVRVRRIVQVGCAFEFQAGDWFRGFVLTMRQGEGNFDPERLRFAEENEYTEGDISDKVLAWNDGSHPPPTTFRRGTVRRSARFPGAVKKSDFGHEVRFPGGGPLPTPIICDGRLFVSGGFSSRSYHALEARSLKHRWSIDLSDNGPSSAACARGTLSFNTESCTLFTVDAKTGGGLWSHWLGDPLASMPSAKGNRLFAVYPAAYASRDKARRGKAARAQAGDFTRPKISPTHVLAAIHARTGKFLWQRWIDAEAITAPVVADGKVVLATMSGTLYAFSEGNGRLIAATRHRLTGAPAFHAGRWWAPRRLDGKSTGPLEGMATILAGNAAQERPTFGARYLDRKLTSRSLLGTTSLALDRANGFHNGAPAAAHAEPAFVHLGIRTVSALQFFEGARPLVLADRLIVVFQDQLVALGHDGRQMWTLQLEGDAAREGGPLASSPAFADGHVFVSTGAGRVLVVEVATGQVVRRFDAGSPLRAQPLVHEGRIYAPGRDGQLFVFDTGRTYFTGWTAWGGNPSRSR